MEPSFDAFKGAIEAMAKDSSLPLEDRAAALWLCKLSIMPQPEQRIGRILKSASSLNGYEKAALQQTVTELLRDPAIKNALRQSMAPDDRAIEKDISRRWFLGHIARLSGVTTLTLTTLMAAGSENPDKAIAPIRAEYQWPTAVNYARSNPPPPQYSPEEQEYYRRMEAELGPVLSLRDSSPWLNALLAASKAVTAPAFIYFGGKLAKGANEAHDRHYQQCAAYAVHKAKEVLEGVGRSREHSYGRA